MKKQLQRAVALAQDNGIPNEYTTKLLICMDSNCKYLDPRKLWSLQDTTRKHCPRILAGC